VIFTILSLKSSPKLPAALLGLAIVTALSSYLEWDLKRVGSMTAQFPDFHLPSLTGGEWISLTLLSLPLALLGATESLLSARVIDRLEPKARPHHPNLELLGQGLSNLAVGFFSGSTVTGVVVRSTVNIQSGGKTKLSAAFHGAILLLALLYFSESLAKIPVAALAGLLCLIGFRLLEGKELIHLAQVKPVQAVAFLIAMVGTLNDALFFGLVSAIAIALISQRISDRLKASEEFSDHAATPGLRAVIGAQEEKEKRHEDWRVFSARPNPDEPWIRHVSETPWIHPSSYVHPNATLIGRIFVDRGVHVAAETSVRADEGTPFFIGNRTNLQDGVVLHALKGKHVQVRGTKWAIYIDEQVSVAHQALIHGPCYIGAHTFIGFKAIVHDAVVGEECFVGIGAVVVGVKVPDGKFVPHGTIVDTQEKANNLPPATEAHHEFNEDVVDVNQGLAQAYHWQALQEQKKINTRTRKEDPWNSSFPDSESESQSPSYF
jgi:SulP family sulfate permease